jgi:response regulator (family protein to RR01Spn & sth)
MGVEKVVPVKKVTLDLFLCFLICYNRKKKRRKESHA